MPHRPISLWMPASLRAHRPTWIELRTRLASDVVGGALLLLATGAALVISNSAAAYAYTAVRDYTIGPAGLHLNLSIGDWIRDGLLAIFFFVVGLELKQEFVTGRLRDPRQAAVPVLAACGGAIAPALIFVAINTFAPGGHTTGWAVPTATDIAFSAAILAVAGRYLPAALRVFLLTLAIADDLIAIVIIALTLSPSLHFGPLVGAVIALGAFAALVRRGVRTPWILVPLAVTTWALVHAGGIHPTIAAVALACTVPAVPTTAAHVATPATGGGNRYIAVSTRMLERLSPISTLFVLPVFAFFAAGIDLRGDGGAGSIFNPVTLGVVAGLVIGKPLGIVGATYLATRLRTFTVDPALTWSDLVAMGMTAGIGFTISLLIGDLAFGAGSLADTQAKLGVLLGSAAAGIIGTVLLVMRGQRHKATRQV
ncbi:Na+/H+ antiporter NhaA [Rarobacter incanus]|uniref:Na(+)/H(+) antiporter NhaA n=1 Tax=Rarobacter incanus TaxID=153494 RepID=A0A542SQ72_9MICO|nr:Na+/H+ antiporter NhaA [Rarobacter incanus]TQK76756.1 sodium/proton antiporter (NhaA family) [Rarobacter incanus]